MRFLSAFSDYAFVGLFALGGALSVPLETAFAGTSATPPAAAADVVPIAPLKILAQPLPGWRSGEWGAPAGDWKAPTAALDYTAARVKALAAEAARDWPAALTAWERVLDRTTCSEEQREEARRHVRALRQEVQPNTDPAKAKKWATLAVIYKEVAFDTQRRGQKVLYHKTMTPKDLIEIGGRLSAFRDLVFYWTNGVLLLDIEPVVVNEPLKNMTPNGGGFMVNIGDAAPAVLKIMRERGKRYNTVLSYVNHRGGATPAIPSPPFAAATYGILPQFGGAGYVMVPYWSQKWPTEPLGEAELHEWLHQVDSVVHEILGYPPGTTRSSDDGRHVGDNRPGGDHEYKKPHGVRTWVFLYRHLMQEHMTRQIWSEMSTDLNLDPPPGKVIKIK
jgi:hypothetical protein